MVSVYLDPGHGGRDIGASNSQTTEAQVNLTVALATKQELENKGVKVYMSRSSNTDTVLEDLTDEANKLNVDRFVSIHSDAGGGNRTNAHSLAGTKGWQLSNSIMDSFQKSGYFPPHSGTRHSNFLVLRETKMPSSLVEVGFLDNPKSFANFDTVEEQQKIGKMIAQGILNDLGISSPIQNNPQVATSTTSPKTSPNTSLSSAQIKNAQSYLARRGYYEGVIDGLNGPLTRAAVEKLQEGAGLPVTGELDKKTLAEIEDNNFSKLIYSFTQKEYKLGDFDKRVANIQQNLKVVGLFPGDVNGKFGPETKKAVELYQGQMKLQQTGKVDIKTASLVVSFPEKEKVDKVFLKVFPGFVEYELIRGKSKLEDMEAVGWALYGRIAAAKGDLATVVKGWHPKGDQNKLQRLIQNSTAPQEGTLVYTAARNIITFAPETPLGRLGAIFGFTDYVHLAAMPGGRKAMSEGWIDKERLSSLAPKYHKNLENRVIAFTESGEPMSLGYDSKRNLPTISELVTG